MSLFIIIAKMPFLSSLLIFLYCEFINRASYTRINIFISKGYLMGIFIKVI
jgi:hypothetical protein